MKTATTRILFVHHSVGRYILSKGGLREKLARRLPSAELWDHDYNKFGLSDGAGRRCERSFPIPGDDTDPAGLLELLRGVKTAQSFAEEILSFDILLLKSCYPNNAIESDEQQASMRRLYEELHGIASTLPMQVVLATSPPLAPERTNADERARARETARWLMTLWSGSNTKVVDVFGALASSAGPFAGSLDWAVRRPWPMDSHPGRRGCARAADLVVEGLVEVTRAMEAESSGGAP